MSLPKDKEGNTLVTVKDIKEYLSKYPEETPVYLDKDGWQAGGGDYETVQSLIKGRGLFYKGKDYLIINN